MTMSYQCECGPDRGLCAGCEAKEIGELMGEWLKYEPDLDRAIHRLLNAVCGGLTTKEAVEMFLEERRFGFARSGGYDEN